MGGKESADHCFKTVRFAAACCSFSLTALRSIGPSACVFWLCCDQMFLGLNLYKNVATTDYEMCPVSVYEGELKMHLP